MSNTEKPIVKLEPGIKGTIAMINTNLLPLEVSVSAITTRSDKGSSLTENGLIRSLASMFGIPLKFELCSIRGLK